MITFSSSSAEVVLCRDTPVVCRSMTGSYEHINRKLGLVVDFDLGTKEYDIMLEEETTQTPLKIKSHNVRVAFELPP